MRVHPYHIWAVVGPAAVPGKQVTACTAELCRPDGKVSYGYSLMRGKRSNMEDFHHAQVRVCCATALLLLLFGVSHCTKAHWLSDVSACLQFRTEPVSGESVGLFGVFDGERG